jgi:hypothetical protein
MSFLSVLSKIGHAIVSATPYVQAAAPAIEMIPGVGTIFGAVLQGVILVEHAFPQPNLGAQKQAIVAASVAAQFPSGEAVDIKTKIDDTVRLLNELAALETP